MVGKRTIRQVIKGLKFILNVTWHDLVYMVIFRSARGDIVRTCLKGKKSHGKVHMSLSSFPNATKPHLEPP